MGMYTELVMSCRLKDDKEMIGILSYMLKLNDKPLVLPEHELFKTERWPHMLIGSSYYFIPRSIHLLDYDKIGEYWCFISRSDFKNYDREVEKFINWLTPNCRDADMIGYSRYEEDKMPTIYYGKETT